MTSFLHVITKRKKKKMNDRRKISEIFLTWISPFAMLVTGIFAMVQYLEYKHTVKVERSMEYVREFSSNDAIVKARARVNSAIQNYSEQLTKELTSGSGAAGKYEKSIIALVAKEGLANELDSLFYFFEELALCVETELCDGDVAKSFFARDAVELFHSFYPYICQKRINYRNPTIAKRVQIFFVENEDDMCGKQ